MSSSTELFAVIPTLVILLHWPLQPFKSTTLSRKTPCHNKIYYFCIRNIHIESIWADPGLMSHLFPEVSLGKSSKVVPFNQVSVSWLAFASVIGLFEGKPHVDSTCCSLRHKDRTRHWLQAFLHLSTCTYRGFFYWAEEQTWNFKLRVPP